MITFQYPIIIICGTIICTLYTLFVVWQNKNHRKKMAGFATSHLLKSLTLHKSKTRQRAKNSLFIAAVFLLFVALARPQYGFEWVETQRKGIDILFALDTSKSMLTKDIQPNRLERARYGILDFIQKLDGDRIGLIPFAGSAYLMCPLTLDYGAFSESLLATDTNIIPTGGTNLSELIVLAEQTLAETSNHKILVVLTDGEVLQGDAIKTAEEAAKAGLSIYTIGIGTQNGEYIPDGLGGFIRDKDGTPIRSQLNEDLLQQVSTVTGGSYFPLGKGAEGLEAIYNKSLKDLPKNTLKEGKTKVPVERFALPLALAIILLVIESLLSESRNQLFRRQEKTGITTLSCLLLILLVSHVPAHALTPEEQLYEDGKYTEAEEIYNSLLAEDKGNPALLYNLGTTLYKQGSYDKAIESFTQSLSDASPDLQVKTYENIGKSLFQKGAQTKDTDPKKTKDIWEKSLDNFEAVMQIDPQNKDAKKSKKFVQDEIAKLPKPPENQQDQQDQQDQHKKNGSDPEEQGENEKKENQNTDIQANEDKQEGVGTEPGSQPPMPRDVQKEQTASEIERMLQALEEEEGRLNFVPKSSSTRVYKDW